MKKRKTSKKISQPKRKASGRYLQLSLFAAISGIIFFLVGGYLIPQHIPCANTKSCQSDLSEHFDTNATGIFEGKKVIAPSIDLAQTITQPAVLGTSDAAGEKHIYVDLSTQRLYAYQGDTEFMETFIASGKWNPTPVGNFKVWEKLRSTRMSGGEGADYYDLPNVPYTMYFYQDYGIHGAYWHNNFGHEMSHGCVNMRIVDAQKLYNWTPMSTPVSVCKTFSGPNKCVQS